ncbi:hypothetical protein EB796_006840 [Bugula neritina]|uniref:Uncharacterized protein n=1 Tax=Bugula neritina TaxID=10212 RepID=A0A7J7KAI1_BUGNE|nr:hypothetical protein EB796_006840 [Bugula neritina]
MIGTELEADSTRQIVVLRHPKSLWCSSYFLYVFVQGIRVIFLWNWYIVVFIIWTNVRVEENWPSTAFYSVWVYNL